MSLKPDGRRNLVLGIIEHYTFEELRPFLVSLRRSGYIGDIVFFYQFIDGESLRKIRQYDVKLIRFHSLRSAWGGGFRRNQIERVCQFYHRVKWPFYGLGWKALLGVAKLRYPLFHRFLRQHEQEYRHVLLADTRDILFQADPFEPAPAEDLLFYEESHSLSHGELNPAWIKIQLGEAMYERLAPKTTICSGTTIGTPVALCWYLERTMELMKKACSQSQLRGDQALHNAIVYEGMKTAPFSFRICRNGEGQVYTLTRYMEPGEIRQGPGGAVVDSAGRPIPVVHQYDRHPLIADALLKQYAP